MCSGCFVLAVVGHYVPGIMISYIIGESHERESPVSVLSCPRTSPFLKMSVSPFSPERAAVAAGGLPRTDPEDVHGPGADPDEAGLQHEGGHGAPQARQKE